MKNLIKLALTGAFVASVAAASAVPLLVEDFNFSGLLTANGWTAHSGGGTQAIDTTTGLTYTGYSGSGIGNAANIDNNGEDDNKLFTAQTSGTVYASFMVSVPTSTVTEGYFFTLGPQLTPPTGLFDPAAIRPKVYLTTDGTGDYELGLQYASNTVTNKSALNLTFNTTYLVVLKYVINAATNNDDAASLFIITSGVPGVEPGSPTLGPVISGTDTVGGTDIANVAGVAFRQYNALENVIVDGIRVDTVWPLGAADVADWTVYN